MTSLAISSGYDSSTPWPQSHLWTKTRERTIRLLGKKYGELDLCPFQIDRGRLIQIWPDFRYWNWQSKMNTNFWKSMESYLHDYTRDRQWMLPARGFKVAGKDKNCCLSSDLGYIICYSSSFISAQRQSYWRRMVQSVLGVLQSNAQKPSDGCLWW